MIKELVQRKCAKLTPTEVNNAGVEVEHLQLFSVLLVNSSSLTCGMRTLLLGR